MILFVCLGCTGPLLELRADPDTSAVDSTNWKSYAHQGCKVFVKDSQKATLPVWNERMWRQTPENSAKTQEIHSFMISSAYIDDDKLDDSPMTLNEYLMFVLTHEANVMDLLMSWEISAPLSIQGKDGTVISGRWLKYVDNPPLILHPGDKRNVLAWDKLLYGFPVVASLEAVRDRFSEVTFKKYAELWSGFGDRVMHMPVLWGDWDDVIDDSKQVTLHRVEFTRLLSRVTANMMDYTSQEDWENRDEGSLSNFHILRSPSLEKFPYAEGHTYRTTDLLTFFKKQKAAYGWIQLSADDDNDMGYDPTRRYYRFPYPDVWVDEESMIYLAKRLDTFHNSEDVFVRERLPSFLLVPDLSQREIKIGSRDGMMGLPSSMHGKAENMYKIFPYNWEWDQYSWNAAWIEHIVIDPWYSVSKTSVIDMVRKILASLHVMFYENRSSDAPPPLADTPENVLKFIHLGLTHYENNRSSFHLTCHWPLYLYNFGIEHIIFIDGVPKLASPYEDHPFTTSLTQRLQLDQKLEETKVKLDSVLNEVENIYRHNYCEEPYKTWIAPSRPFVNLPGSIKFGGAKVYAKKNAGTSRSSLLRGSVKNRGPQ